MKVGVAGLGAMGSALAARLMDRHGPRRLLYGTARDLLIGCRFVLADGNIGHSGGRVITSNRRIPDQPSSRGSAQTGTSCRQTTSGPSAATSSIICRK